MRNTVYGLASTEPQANQMLTHLRNLGFSASEVSILLKQKETKNISIRKDAIRGVEKDGLVGGALGAIGTTVLSLPLLGPLRIAGPILAALDGGGAGGVVGGLGGGSGGLTHIGIPENAIPRLHGRVQEGAILIAVHSDDSTRRDKALRVFKSSGAEDVYSSEDIYFCAGK